MPVDLKDFYDRNKSYFGDKPLADVANEAYQKSGAADTHTYDQWLDWTGTGREQIEEDTYQRESKKPGSLFRRSVADPAVSLAKGTVGLGDAIIGGADLLTGGYAGKTLEDMGYDSQAINQGLEKLYSPQQRMKNQELAETKGFMPSLEYAVKNPSTIVHSIIESAPSMYAGGAVARGLLSLAPKAMSAAGGLTGRMIGVGAKEATPILAGSIGEGVVQAGGALEQARQDSPDKLLTPGQSGLAVGSGILDALIVLGSGKIANKFGISDIENLMAGGKTASVIDRATGKEIKKGIARKTVEAMINEGLLQELPQSAQEQILQNLAGDKPWDEGVGQAAVMGLLTGAAMGGGATAYDKAVAMRGPHGKVDLGDIPAPGQTPPSTLDPSRTVNLGDIPAPPSGPITAALQAGGLAGQIVPGMPIDLSRDVPVSGQQVPAGVAALAGQVPGQVPGQVQGQEFQPTGPPSTAEQAAQVLAGQKTPAIDSAFAMQQAGVQSPYYPELDTDTGVPSEVTARDIKSLSLEDLQKARPAFEARKRPDILSLIDDEIAEKKNTVPEHLRQIFGIMRDEAQAGGIESLRDMSEGAGMGSTTSVGRASSHQQWLRDLNKQIKDEAPDIGGIDKNTFANLLNKKETGQPLTGRQETVWNFMQDKAEEYNKQHPDTVLSQDEAAIRKRGFEPNYGQEVKLMSLAPGDKVLFGDEEFKFKGFDDQGQIVFQDGEKILLDPFETITPDGIKKAEQPGKAEIIKEPYKGASGIQGLVESRRDILAEDAKMRAADLESRGQRGFKSVAEIAGGEPGLKAGSIAPEAGQATVGQPASITVQDRVTDGVRSGEVFEGVGKKLRVRMPDGKTVPLTDEWTREGVRLDGKSQETEGRQGETETGQVSVAPPAELKPGSAGVTPVPSADKVSAREGQEPALVRVRDVYGSYHYLKQSDMDNPEKTGLKRYSKDGKPLEGPIHRDNLDPTGEKQKALNAQIPAPDVILNSDFKNGIDIPFESRGAALSRRSKEGLQDTHEVVPAAEVGGKEGFVIRKKTVPEYKPGTQFTYSFESKGVYAVRQNGVAIKKVSSTQEAIAHIKSLGDFKEISAGVFVVPKPPQAAQAAVEPPPKVGTVVTNGQDTGKVYFNADKKPMVRIGEKRFVAWTPEWQEPSKQGEPPPETKTETKPSTAQGEKRSIKDAIAAGRAGTPVVIADIRKQFPEMGKSEFDAEILGLAKAGGYFLSRHAHPAQATEAEKTGMIEFVNKGERGMPDVPGYYYSINKREAAPKAEFSPAQAIRSAADNIESLRPVDVYRVMSENKDHLDEMKDYIVKNHSGNQRMLDKVKAAYDELSSNVKSNVADHIDGVKQDNIQQLHNGFDAVKQIISGKDVIKSVINRPEYGAITLDFGKPGTADKDFKNGYGLSHIAVRRSLEGNDPANAILDAIETTVLGKEIRRYGPEQGLRIDLEHNGNIAVLSLHRFGEKETWLLTGFKNKPGAQAVSINQLGYAPDASGIRQQVGADLEKNISARLEKIKTEGSSISPRTATTDVNDKDVSPSPTPKDIIRQDFQKNKQSEIEGGADQKANTEDSGAELTYNKRNRIKGGIKWADIKDKNTSLQVKETTKDNVYPKPDYQKMIDGGLPPIAAHLIKQAYDSISTKPSLSIAPTEADLQTYINAVNRVMDGVVAWANNKESVRRWAGGQAYLLGAELGKTSIDISDMAKETSGSSLLDTIYPDGWKIHKGEVHILGGNKLLRALQPGRDEAQRASKDIGSGWPVKQESWQKQGYKVVSRDDVKAEKHGYTDGRIYSLELNGRTIQGQRFETTEQAEAAIKAMEPWLLTKKGRFEGQFPTEEAATEAARNAVKRENKGPGISEKGISVEAARRIGVEHRLEGEDITSDKLRETFGFKGINFGNWVKGDSNKAERQLHLNHAYDSFLDLAEVLGIPPKAMSLNGMLGLAIGAQGSGGFAAAHFVCGVNEINLTRTAGAGSISHEWAHAIDHYFANQAKLSANKEPFLSEHAGNAAYVWPGSIRDEIVSRFKSIIQAINEKSKTPEQMDKEIQARTEKAKKNGDAWLREIKNSLFMGIPEDTMLQRDGKDTSANKIFDRLAERIKNLDLGEGREVIGKPKSKFDISTISFSPVVSELRDLYKELHGRVPSLDQFKGLQGNLDYSKYLSSEEGSQKAHEPQMTKTDYTKEARTLDAKKKKPYWNTNVEKFARAFDAFVSDSLEKKEAQNTYLSHAGRDDVTVPRGEERKAINGAFKALVDEIQTKETDTGTILFSDATEKRLGNVTAAQARAEFKSLIDNLNAKGDVSLNIASDPSQITDDGLRREVMAHEQESGRLVKGFFHQETGTLYVFTDRANSMKEVAAVIAHELTGHYGLYEFMGPELQPFLDFLNRHTKYSAQVQKTARNRGIDMSTQEGRDAAAKEWFAELIEKGDIEPSLWTRFVVAFKNALRRWGINTEFTDADIAEIVRGARNAVEGKGKSDALFAGNAVVDYQDAWHGTPHVWPPEPGFPHGRPRLDKIGTGEGNQAYGYGLYSADVKDTAKSYQDAARWNALKSMPNNEITQAATELEAGISESEVRDGMLVLGIPKERHDAIIRDARKLVENIGATYKLDIPDSVIPRLLDWDKSLSKQSEYVQNAIKKEKPEFFKGLMSSLKGRDFYHRLSDEDAIPNTDGNKAASEYLASIGIPGNRYLDQFSRPVSDTQKARIEKFKADIEKLKQKIGNPPAWSKDQPGIADGWEQQLKDLEANLKKAEADANITYNYVLWDQSVLDQVALLERNGEKLDEIRGAGQVDYSEKARLADVIKAEKESFGRKMDDYQNGKLKPGETVTLGKPSDILLKLGARDVPVTISQATLKKVLHEKHGLSSDIIKQIPEQLRDPIMVFDSATQKNSLVVMTELEHEGKTVVAAIHLSKMVNHIEVNDIASIHPRQNDSHFTNWIQDGLLRYANKEKSRDWFMTRGLQLPKMRGTNDSFKKRILTEDGFVKQDDLGSLLEKQKALILPRVNARDSEPSVKDESSFEQKVTQFQSTSQNMGRPTEQKITQDRNGINKNTSDPDIDYSDKDITGDDAPIHDYLNARKTAKEKEGSAKWRAPAADVTQMDLIFGQMLYYAPKVPALKKMFDASGKALDNKTQKQRELLYSPDGKMAYPKELERIEKAHREQFQTLGKYLVTLDMAAKGYKVKQKDEHTDGGGVQRTFILVAPVEGWKEGTFNTEAEAWKAAIEYEAEAYGKFHKNVHPDIIKALTMFRTIGHNMYDMLYQSMETMIAEHEKAGTPMPEFSFDDASTGQKVRMTLKKAMAEMGDIRGSYFPRTREPGAFTLIAKKGDANPILEKFDIALTYKDEDSWMSKIPLPINRRAAELKKQGYDVTMMKSDALPESVFLELSGQSIALESLLTQAFDKLNANQEHSLKDMGITSKWDGKDFVISGEGIHAKTHPAILQHLGGEYKYVQKKGQEGYPSIRFKDAKENIADEVKDTLLKHAQSVFVDTMFGNSLITTLADIFKARGGRSGMVARHKGVGIEVWKGYEENPITAFTRAALGIAGATAKGELARQLHGIITGRTESWAEYQQRIVDTTPATKASYAEYQKEVEARKISATKQPNAYKLAQSYTQNMLRNDEQVDRVVGVAGGLAVLKYLWGRPGAVFVNLTNMAAGVPGSMTGHAGIPLAKAFGLIGKAGLAYKDYKFGDGQSLNKWTLSALEHIEKNGWDQAQYNQEAMAPLKGKFGRAFEKIMEYGMLGFSVSEKINRVSTILGTYMGIKEMHDGAWTESLHQAALEKAKEVSDKAHGVYGDVNRPYLAQGGGVAGNVAKSWFMFKTFSHNYVLNMIELGFKKEIKAMSYLALAPAIMAGASATALAPFIKAACMAFGVDDPEEEFYDWIEKEMGSGSMMYARTGLLGLGGNGPALKGSLAIGLMDLPTSVSDLLGAPAGIVKDLADGAKAIGRGDLAKGTEKILPNAMAGPIRAWRESTEGMTTAGNAPRFFGDQQVKLTGFEAAMRSLSFNPARIAVIQDIQRGEYKAKELLTKQRTEIYSRARRAIINQDQDEYADVLARMNRYNLGVKSNDRYEGYPLLTWKKIMQNARKAQKPSKLERNRQIEF